MKLYTSIGVYTHLLDLAILQAQNDDDVSFGILIDMYRQYRNKRRKLHKGKLTEMEYQYEFWSLYKEEIKQECKGIVERYKYKVHLEKTKNTREYLLDIIGQRFTDAYQDLWEFDYLLKSKDKTKRDYLYKRYELLHNLYIIVKHSSLSDIGAKDMIMLYKAIEASKKT